MSTKILAMGALFAMVIAVAAISGRGTAQAQLAGPEITLTCPASAGVGATFSCNVSLAYVPAPGDAHTGFQMGIIYDGAGISAVPGSWDVSDASTLAYPGGTLVSGALYDAAPQGTFNPGELVTRIIVNSNPQQDVLYEGSIGNVEFTCLAAGAQSLTLRDPVDTATQGAYTISTTAEVQNNVRHSAVVNCEAQAIVEKTANGTTFSPGDVVQYTLTVVNGTGGDMTNVLATDNFDPAIFDSPVVLVSATNGATDVSPSGTGNCSVAGLTLTCDGGLTILDGDTLTVVIDATVRTDAPSGDHENCFDVNSDQTSAQQGCVTVNILPSGVVWTKEFVDENGDPTGETAANLWLSSGGESITFAEIMINQSDPAGLGAFEFQIWYDNAIWNQPVVDMSPAIALFDSFGWDLHCDIGFQLETRVHVACASTQQVITNPPAPGPTWVGPMVLAYVTFTPKNVIIQSIKPAKYNGLVAWIKNTHIEAANICGSPLNDGSSSYCQGELLPGVLPGGQIDAGDPELVVTIRRLEGDVTKTCEVDVLDMQALASRYGTKLGSLLYNAWFDLEPHQPTSGDGDIDIKDVQFVYGRFGSTCDDPIGNPQEPENHPSI